MCLYQHILLFVDWLLLINDKHCITRVSSWWGTSESDLQAFLSQLLSIVAPSQTFLWSLSGWDQWAWLSVNNMHPGRMDWQQMKRWYCVAGEGEICCLETSQVLLLETMRGSDPLLIISCWCKHYYNSPAQYYFANTAAIFWVAIMEVINTSALTSTFQSGFLMAVCIMIFIYTLLWWGGRGTRHDIVC